MTKIYLLNLSYPNLIPDYHTTLTAYYTPEKAEEARAYEQERATENAVYYIEEISLF